MKISKGNVRNVNKRILAGAIAFTFLATKLIGCQVIKQKKYSQVKLGYVQTEDVDIVIKEDYAVLPKKIKLNSNDFPEQPNNPKDNYKKNKDNGLNVKRKRKVLHKML